MDLLTCYMAMKVTTGWNLDKAKRAQWGKAKNKIRMMNQSKLNSLKWFVAQF